MITYQDYEKEVYNWLMAKHNQNNEFTFSLRKKATKGSEKNYFIGTEKSKYFGTTFWYIKTGYPGSSSDLINVIFIYSNEDKLVYYIEFNQTKNPDSIQNELALKLVQNLEKPISNKIGLRKKSSDKQNYYNYRSKSHKLTYDNIPEMLEDVSKDIEVILPIIDAEIEKIKTDNPEFIAHRISQEEFSDMQEKLKNRIDVPDKQPPIKEVVEKHTDKHHHSNPLNQILYGPPGTGKTYNTIIRAAQIIDNKIITDYSEALRIFNEHLRDRIEFITFHQNYSYEDFIQGLRPDVDNGPELTFERKDGVFKRIADRALKNITDSEKPSEAKRSFDIVFNEFISPLSKEEVEEIEVPMKKVSFYINVVTSKSIEFRKNDGDSKHSLSIATLRKMYDKGENDLIIGGLQPYYNPILSVLLKKGKSSVEHVTCKNFVIIIDEINRANISRVFGELITLIECDKRSHGAIPLRCTLPSGDEFIVPSNLYIIGTMNTADKSIALLDIALRRRFEFEPMYPLYEIEGHQIYDVEILEKINKRIKELKGHDFQIGHSYFMGDNKDLVERMNKKVIPLLLEYFMNDEKEVKGILMGAGLSVEPDSWPLKINGLL